MLRRLHIFSPFWVSLWLSSLLCLLVLPLWLSQPVSASGEVSFQAAGPSAWAWMPGEWALEEEEDLSKKETVSRSSSGQVFSRLPARSTRLHAHSRPQAEYALRPAFLAYHHLRR